MTTLYMLEPYPRRPCPAAMTLGSNSNNNNTGSWFCTLSNGTDGVLLPSASLGLQPHCAECPGERGCVQTGTFSYSWTLPKAGSGQT